MHWELAPKNHQIALLFWSDATNVNSVVFKDSKGVQKGGPKTGPWTDRYYSLITYKDGQLLRSGKSMCQNATFYEQWRHLHIPFAKSNYFSRRRTNERTNEQDFGQSNLALSNVRALRAISQQDFKDGVYKFGEKWRKRWMKVAVPWYITTGRLLNHHQVCFCETILRVPRH